MSRIGKMPVGIPAGVKIDVAKEIVNVEGPKGKLSVKLLDGIVITVENDNAVISRKSESKRVRAFHGLVRKLLYNAVIGVSDGFTKNLLVNGVGYRAEVKDKFLILSLGYSNPIEFYIPDGITITCEGNNKIVVNGIDKQLVGQTSAEIRSLRPPEPYKGKGVKYEDEIIVRKVGKAGVS